MANKDALTPAQLKLIQDKLPKSSPYNKGKSPFKKDKLSKKKGHDVDGNDISRT